MGIIIIESLLIVTKIVITTIVTKIVTWIKTIPKEEFITNWTNKRCTWKRSILWMTICDIVGVYKWIKGSINKEINKQIYKVIFCIIVFSFNSTINQFFLIISF